MTKERIILPNGTESWKILADEGMTFKRVADGIVFGNEVILGYRYRDAEGNLLEEKVLELPEDFEEVVDDSPEMKELEPLEMEAL